MAYTVFTLKSSSKNADGILRFESAGDLTPMNISSCNISTTAAADLIEFGKEPSIIPMGIESCTAEIVGTFRDPKTGSSASSVFPVGKLAKEIKSFYDTIKIFDKVNDKDVLYALELSSANQGGCRELENGTWKISKVNYDRSATKMGSYQFNMQLTYHWNNKQEQEVGFETTGSESKTDCSFTVVFDGFTHTIYNVKVVRSLLMLNNAQFDSNIKIPKDKEIKIYAAGNLKTIFHGIISAADLNQKDNIYTMNAKEIGDLLYKGVVGNFLANIASGVLPELRVIIPCREGKTNFTIAEMVTKIASYYKAKDEFKSWKPFPAVCTAGDLSNKSTLPGRKNIQICNQLLSGISVGTALTNFLYRECGFNMWFNYDTGRLEYGFVRGNGITINVSKEIIAKTTLIDDNQEDIIPDFVAVWDPSCKYCGMAGEYGQDKHGIQYVLSDERDASAAQALAEKLLYLCTQVDRSTYSVEFPAGTTRFNEGEYFNGLGDQTLLNGENMTYRSGEDADPLNEPGDAVWQIKEMVITDKSTTVTVGTSFYSTLDVYKSALNRRRDGIPTPTKQQVLQTQEIVVGKGAGGSATEEVV